MLTAASAVTMRPQPTTRSLQQSCGGEFPIRVGRQQRVLAALANRELRHLRRLPRSQPAGTRAGAGYLR
jgi:hypothetical protein